MLIMLSCGDVPGQKRQDWKSGRGERGPYIVLKFSCPLFEI